METGNISLIGNTQNTYDKLLILGFFILIYPFQWSKINQKNIAQFFGNFIHGLLGHDLTWFLIFHLRSKYENLFVYLLLEEYRRCVL